VVVTVIGVAVAIGRHSAAENEVELSEENRQRDSGGRVSVQGVLSRAAY
jgi:hypothetical protein